MIKAVPEDESNGTWDEGVLTPGVLTVLLPVPLLVLPPDGDVSEDGAVEEPPPDLTVTESFIPLLQWLTTPHMK